MMYTLHYDSPLGGILLAADDVGLTGLWFDGELYFAEGLDPDHTAQKTPILQQAERWLEVYFSGREPGFTPPLHPMGSPFRQAVWELLLQIPYGQTTTTARWQSSWRKSRGGPACLHRQWAVPSGTIGSRSSSRATGSSERTAA